MQRSKLTKKAENLARSARYAGLYAVASHLDEYVVWIESAAEKDLPAIEEALKSLQSEHFGKLSPHAADEDEERKVSNYEGESEGESEGTELGSELARLMAWLAEAKSHKQVALRVAVAARLIAPGVSPYEGWADMAVAFSQTRAGPSKLAKEFAQQVGNLRISSKLKPAKYRKSCQKRAKHYHQSQKQLKS